MSQSSAASLAVVPRRRSRGAPAPQAMAVDARYPQHRVRRAVRAPSPAAPPLPLYAPDLRSEWLPAEAAQWPDWLIPSALVAVMGSITAYHAEALLAALQSLF